MRRTILLEGHLSQTHQEAEAAEAFKPGHRLTLNSSGKLIKNNGTAKHSPRIFAKEDSYQGKTIDDAYASGDWAQYHIAHSGDLIQARVAAGALALAIGDNVVAMADGTYAKAGTNGGQLLSSNTAASAAVTNTTTETAFDKSYTIPAGFLQVGDVIRIRAQAIATSTNSTDTLNLKLKIGSTEIIATGAVDVANNDIGYIEADLVIRTIGASGTFVATGTHALGVPGTVTAKPFYKASTTVDTTATQAITVTATWSVASASNSVRLDVLEVSLVRGNADEPEGRVEKEAVDNSEEEAEGWVKIRMA